MAFYNGYVLLPTNTYLAWETEVSGNGYDADGSHGDQCWDLTAEFWYNIGFPQGYPLTGPNHAAYECWSVNRFNNSEYNGVTYFQLITTLEDIKKGDIVVYNGNNDNPSGHIGFAAENYDPSKNGYLAILGQNQGSGGTPPAVINPDGGTTANIKDLYTATDFLGAFRYVGWSTPPTPITGPKSHFPWVLYARKLRNNNII